MKKFGGQGKKKQKCIHRVCTRKAGITNQGENIGNTQEEERMGNTQEGEWMGDTQEEERMGNTQEGEWMGDTQEEEQMGNTQEGEWMGNTQKGERMGNTQKGEQEGNAQEKGNPQEGKWMGNTQVLTPPPLFFPLRTTPELYAVLTEAFLDKPLVYDPHKGMVFDPPRFPEYTTHVSTLKHSGRMINTTVPDSNCLFRSLSKALLGTEKYHYRIRTRLLGFVYANSNIFMSHIQQRCQSQVEVREYCLSMDRSGVWGTEIEILAAATLLQAPLYTYTQTNSNSYRWLRYLPMSPAHSVNCDYHDSIHRLVYTVKPADYHLELFHFNRSHYDVIVADNEDSRLSFPPLSNFECSIVI